MRGMRGAGRGWLGVAVTGLATAVVGAAVVAHVTRAPRVTSWAAASDAVALLALLAAVALLVAGALALALEHDTSGGLCLLLAVVWVAPVLVGWEAGSPALRSVATMVPVLAAPALFHLAVAAQRAPGRAARVAVVGGYLVLGGLGVVAGAVHNPFLDLDAWSNLSDFAFVDADPGLAAALRRGLLVSTVLVGVVAVAVVVVRALRRTRWRGATIWGPALLAVAGEAGYAVLLLREPLERFTLATGLALYVLRALALTAVAVGVAWQATTRRRLQRRMRNLLAELAHRPPAGTFEESMRTVLRDDSVEVRYWMRERAEYVDAAGVPCPDPGADARGRARIVRGYEPVALVTYDPELVGDAFLEQQLGAAARLAIDNERLRAESLAHLRELADSRARLVAAADHERRTLERDLHDGAQQRLLAVLFELRLARADAMAAGDAATVARLDAAVASADAALSELREFAHGVFPAVLDESGLEQALWSLADRARVPVDLDVRLEAGPAGPVAERTAYLVAKAALDASVEELTLDVSRQDGQLVLVASGVGEVDEEHLSDRVGAVGGELRHGEGRLEAVIPCG